jgi:hypothetical protein
MFIGVRQGSVLSPVLLNIVINEIIRVTEGQESWLPNIIVYTDDIVTWELSESTLDKKFQRVVSVCKDFGLNVNLDKYVVKYAWRQVHGKDKI